MKLNRLPANSIAELNMFSSRSFLVDFSPTLPARTGARVCVMHFLPPPHRKREKNAFVAVVVQSRSTWSRSSVRRCRPCLRKSTLQSYNIPNDIVSTDDIDYAIGALTNHIRTVADNSSRKALKTEGIVPVPALRKSDKSVAFNDRKKAECLADSIEEQCSKNSPYDLEHVRRVEEEVRYRVSLPPKDDLDSIAHDEITSPRKDQHRNNVSIDTSTEDINVLLSMISNIDFGEIALLAEKF
ncbi:hypothetical protein EVAR_84645_1 [Eumeta japonica]|uniref:Uncharacterized protein n=1 Tax=Eumeta variegata TaxID=151549 RepID=A0A4C1UYG9_EUMVA|nr:hypothetical protein EVAR_84645_1 [Eumeta japonica]